ncbi:hypothetical protein C1H46_043452 [Malus baccata]|uniref:Uncharacterized protein n=2 Tax=Malus TaxID=3749 RepID=A0A540K9W7_MALBA|nr:hypothetical protein C1H46_043452 [Malus baccata]
MTPKDLSFVGYTYKNFDAVKGLRQALGDARVDFTAERAAKEAELQMLASAGDPMLP